MTVRARAATASRTTPAAPARHVGDGLVACEARMAGALSSTAAEPLRDVALETVNAGGKRLRPMLVLAAGRPAPRERGRQIAAAAAVELLHTATLVHDDVIDGATSRRGRPTVVAAHGPAAAARVGDLLLGAAFREMASAGSARAVTILGGAALEMTRGEATQRAAAFDLGVGRHEYVERCRRKTAALFVAACRIGAIVGGSGPAAERLLAGVAEDLGVAFQILDDVLDITAPGSDTGKARGTDLRDGTVTLPVIMALRIDPALRSEITRRRHEDVEGLCDDLATHDGLWLAREQGLDHVRAARRRAALLPATVDVAVVDAILDGVASRLADPSRDTARAA